MYFRENIGAPFIVGFLVLLSMGAGSLVQGNSDLANMAAIRSDIRLTKDELLEAIKTAPAPSSDSEGNLDDVAVLVKGQFDQIATFIGEALEATKEDIVAAIFPRMTMNCASPDPNSSNPYGFPSTITCNVLLSLVALISKLLTLWG